MQTNPADDFGVFAGSEHMFFGLRDPFALVRAETEAGLRQQVADTALDAIKTFDTPKFLTLGRNISGGKKILVTHFGFCVRAELHVSYAGGSKHEMIDATLTFLFANVERRGTEQCRTSFDLHAEAQQHFTDDVFRQRFLAYRLETVEEPPDKEAPDPSGRKPWWKFWS